MQTVKRACVPRLGTFDPNRRDTVLHLGDLVAGRINAAEFFAENYITEGMRTLLTEGFRRLEGHSTQGVFKLTQAMGGGKTHNLLALGLLAQHPAYRADVMGAFYTPDTALGAVRVVAFSGRESDAPLGVWGAIAEQLGKRDQFKDYYAPLAAPGFTAWVNLLQGEPLVIMLDKLPPYFVNAAAKSIGHSDLATVTTTALANLLEALGREELRNVCVVIADLAANYQTGSAQINAALQDLQGETGPQQGLAEGGALRADGKSGSGAGRARRGDLPASGKEALCWDRPSRAYGRDRPPSPRQERHLIAVTGSPRSGGHGGRIELLYKKQLLI